MAPITDQQLAALAPYIKHGKPDDRGELYILCPLHNDSRQSCSINIHKGYWYCFAGCGGGSIRALMDNQENWRPVEGRGKELKVSDLIEAKEVAGLPSQDELMRDVLDWHFNLMKNDRAKDFLYNLRGIEEWTIRKAMIGFDGSYYKIPVFSPERQIWNIRTYDPEPRRGRRKIWSLRGFGRARIYPAGILERAEPGDAILFCEGEWDALLALQAGALAVTRTDGAGKPWHPEWSVGFAGLRVYVCHDRDKQGDKGNEIVTAALLGVAQSVYQCKLPYMWLPKGGRDVTDLLLDADEPGQALGELMKNAKEIKVDGTKGQVSDSRLRPGGFDSGAYATV